MSRTISLKRAYTDVTNKSSASSNCFHKSCREKVRDPGYSHNQFRLIDKRLKLLFFVFVRRRLNSVFGRAEKTGLTPCQRYPDLTQFSKRIQQRWPVTHGVKIIVIRSLLRQLTVADHVGQKNCSLKDEDELAQIIGNYRVTSDFEWLEFKANIDNHIQKSVFKDENSNSIDSFDNHSKEINLTVEDENEFCFEAITSELSDQSTELSEDIMNQDKKLENCSSVVDTNNLLSSNMNEVDTVSTTTKYNCLETVEETEVLATDRITESVDIRISPRNSTVELINFQTADSFSSEFSLVADVEVKMSDSPDEERIISTFETTLGNNIQSNGDTKETLINWVDDYTSTSDVNESIDTEQCNKDAGKLLNCDILDKEFRQFNDKISNPMDNSKRSNAVRKEPKNTGNVSAFTVESKIAQEIKEMKQREEDLRKMREMRSKDMSAKSENTQTAVPVTVSAPKKETVKQPIETVKPEKEKTSFIKTHVVNGGQSYNIASVFGHKRKDTSKTVDNTPKADKKSSATSTYESPIEKEIRIVKQREEELKREREQALKIKMQLESCQLNVDMSDDDKETVDTFASVSICSDSSFDSGTKLTTPDPKHYDCSLSPTSMNNKINEMYCNSSNAESICSFDSISQSERAVNVNGLQKVFSQNTLKNSSFHNNSIRTPSPDSTSSSSISKMSFPFTSPKQGSIVQNKNVNMERFIASKGKQIVFKNTSPINAVGSSDYMEIKPPQIKKKDQKSQRKFVSAASKIQSELQEMKEREEELKKERARLLGLNGQITDLTPETKDMNHNSNSSTDICSSPDFLENEKEVTSELEKEEVPLNQTRRRSTLIEEWERRIQKSGVQIGQPKQVSTFTVTAAYNKQAYFT
ncbi:uncharacterized protein NPIL_295631 [Nephila pilipes]|uniref:Uncharacterized protein n=1 Tax=Nephila pilipes TaxID=299642 RepID=A0A8X6R8N2_NEPPI|nr:uncharacterized protein NPIL_295631 [Nephila pilipes]